MTKTLKVLPRHLINTDAWNACVAVSLQRVLYGYSWYLDAVLPAPDWKWVGVVSMDETGRYKAVMPIPLRQKRIAGLGKWVVHQPLFCQFLGVFSPDETVDVGLFFQVMAEQYPYGSVFCTRQKPHNFRLPDSIQPTSTHLLDLSVDYDTLYQKYTRDRKQNLRRALAANWILVESANPEALLTLFRENQADHISGGVADWAYVILRNLFHELNQRSLVTLRYALQNGRIEAGALFVQEGNRIIYLFNAASKAGRRGNARTLLIDQVIREKAGPRKAGKSLIFDFESPEKQSIRDFYQSFGAMEEPLWTICWNRLNSVEQTLLSLRNRLFTKR